MGHHLGTTDKSVTAKVTLKGPFGEMVSNVLFEQVSLKKGSSAKLTEIVHAIGVVLSLVLEKELTPFKTRMVNVKGGRGLKLLIAVRTAFPIGVTAVVGILDDVCDREWLTF